MPDRKPINACVRCCSNNGGEHRARGEYMHGRNVVAPKCHNQAMLTPVGDHITRASVACSRSCSVRASSCATLRGKLGGWGDGGVWVGGIRPNASKSGLYHVIDRHTFPTMYCVCPMVMLDDRRSANIGDRPMDDDKRTYLIMCSGLVIGRRWPMFDEG